MATSNRQEEESLQGSNKPASLKPSITNFGTSAEPSCQLYDDWSGNYESDVRRWGYQLPEQVAKVLKSHYYDNDDDDNERGLNSKSSIILDAGAGDGLSGVALRAAGFGVEHTNLIGIDISPKMLQVAASRGLLGENDSNKNSNSNCYTETKVVNLNERLPFSDDVYDAIACVGTLTHMDPAAGTLTEFVRVCKPGGWICYSNRTDKLVDFEQEERRLEEEGKWTLVEKVGPLPYLPDNPEYGEKVQVVIFLYRIRLPPSDAS